MSSTKHELTQTAREWKELQHETPIGLHAASLSLNLLFSLFPLLLVIVSIFGVLNASPVRAQMILGYVRPFVPPDVFGLLADVFVKFLQTSSVGVFSIGFLLLLWAASRTMRGVTGSLDRIYRNETHRHWALRWTIAVAATVMLGLFFFIGSNLLVWGDLFAAWVASHTFVPRELSFLLSNLHWPMLFLLALGAVLLAYKFIPNHDVKTTWRHHLPGALTATFAWIIGSLLFNLYLSSTSRFEIYGAIGLFIVLILYIQLVSYAFLLGAYLNSVWEGLRHRNWLGRIWEGMRGGRANF
ncbi:MAG: hypothetical protein UY82_C0025G0009 [Candidatus Uhrbacteria bacterium GW2011_GWC2_53_7]|uniref:Uncharacterized protein n=1 Tax=Candidatus Uhrbacteria bacterium GW2011_GWC2_53_7 TaxID=1618986 RepID=A0A0G1XZ19_9BACT|nr:MAG: hypothetical protein UY82_C0025G0009 [Candidatus Uhrbacteria bacterium GW2011_GWC2_53_7]